MYQFLLGLILSIAAGPLWALSCTSEYAQTQQECDAIRSWDNLTDYDALDSQADFKVVFHSITALGVFGKLKESWAYKLLNNPKLIGNNPLISASIISKNKNQTFIGEIGLLLSVPGKNIVMTSPSDMEIYGRHSLIQIKDFSIQKRWSIRSPDALLLLTNIHKSWNELRFFGSHPITGKQVAVKGIMLNCEFDKVLRLDRLDQNEFEEKISKCTIHKNKEWRNVLLPLVTRLFQHYPVYGFKTKNKID